MNRIIPEKLSDAAKERNGSVDTNNDLFVAPDGSIHDRNERFPPIIGHIVGAEVQSAAYRAIDTYNALESVGWSNRYHLVPGGSLKISHDDPNTILVMVVATDGMLCIRRKIRK